VSNRHGYLLITNQRFVFVEHETASRYRPLLERPVASVIEVHARAGRSRTVRLRGSDYDLVVHGLRAGIPEQVRAQFPDL
jgi:hypothetical protein